MRPRNERRNTVQRTLDDDDALVISSNAREGGGVAAFDGNVCGVIDNLRTQGLALRGGRFFRALAYSERSRPVCGLLVYDERGVLMIVNNSREERRPRTQDP